MNCELCDRPFDFAYGKKRKKFATGAPTIHHLVPKQKGGKKGERVSLCVPCHKQLHKMYDNKILKMDYYSIEKLKESKKIREWVEWIKRK
jgi:5-methylcytosine-specific restriction protein A